jgi:hypothetical protein
LAWNETSALEWATTGALVFGSAHASLAESTTWAKGNGERWEKPMAIPWFIMFNHVQSFAMKIDINWSIPDFWTTQN